MSMPVNSSEDEGCGTREEERLEKWNQINGSGGWLRRDLTWKLRVSDLGGNWVFVMEIT